MRSQGETIPQIMRELRMGNVVAIERGRGMLVIDPSRFAVGQSPSLALVANMSEEERSRVLFLDAGDSECSFGVNPLAPAPDGMGDAVTRRKETVGMLRDVLVPFMDLDASDDLMLSLLTNMLTLMACTPGATVTDMPTFVESALAREIGLSFVPYGQDETCFPDDFMRFHPGAFDRMMRHGSSVLSDRSRRFVTRRMTLRHMLGQSAPGDISECLRQEAIVVARIPSDGWEGPLCQEVTLRASGLVGNDDTKWLPMSTNEVFSSNPLDADASIALADALCSQAREQGMITERDAIDRQIAERTGLLEGGDRHGWLRLCTRLGL